jgi:ankyrin repeat protein
MNVKNKSFLLSSPENQSMSGRYSCRNIFESVFPLLELPAVLILEVGDHLDNESLQYLASTNAALNHLLFRQTVHRLLYHPCLEQLKVTMKEKDAALHRSVLKGATRFVNYYLSIGAKPHSDIRHNCLFSAIESGKIEIVRAILNAGANPHMGPDPNGQEESAVHIAAKIGFSEAVSLLSAHNICLNVTDYLLWTPLHNAAHGGHIETINCLIQHGAFICPADTRGMTPLHVAVTRGSLATINCLLWHGAPVDAQDNDGKTALHLAILKNDIDALASLIHHGASTKKQDFKGRSPRRYAEIRGSKKILSLLNTRGNNYFSRLLKYKVA